MSSVEIGQVDRSDHLPTGQVIFFVYQTLMSVLGYAQPCKKNAVSSREDFKMMTVIC